MYLEWWRSGKTAETGVNGLWKEAELVELGIGCSNAENLERIVLITHIVVVWFVDLGARALKIDRGVA